MNEESSEEKRMRNYYLDLLDKRRENTSFATKTVSELKEIFEKTISSYRQIDPAEYSKIYKTNSSQIREENLTKREYEIERKRIELMKMEDDYLKRVSILKDWEERLKDREVRLSIASANSTPRQTMHYNTPLSGVIRPHPQVQHEVRPVPLTHNFPPSPSYSDRLVDDSNYDANYTNYTNYSNYDDDMHNAIKQSLEDTLPKMIEEDEDEEECSYDDIDIDKIDKKKSKYHSLSKPENLSDEIIDEIYELLKAYDFKAVKTLFNSDKITVNEMQWILSLKQGESTFKQLLMSKSKELYKIFEI